MVRFSFVLFLVGCSNAPLEIQTDSRGTLWCEIIGGVRECHYISDNQAQEAIEQILRGH